MDFADEETKKAYQDALKLERAAAKRAAEIAEAARTMQIERKRAGRQRNEPTWSDQSRKNRNLGTRVSRVPDTRKILFQNVTSFGHKARTWLLSDQMDYDIMGVAEHHLDVASAAEEAERLQVERYRSIWTLAKPTGRRGTSGRAMAMIKPHWKFSRFLEGYGDFAGPLKRWNWTSIFLAFEWSHFGSGICILIHGRHCTGTQ